MLSGTLAEWREFESGRWRREVDGVPVEEDGVITLSDGLMFSDYYAKRAEPVPPPPRIDPLDDIRSRLKTLEDAAKAVPVSARK